MSYPQSRQNAPGETEPPRIDQEGGTLTREHATSLVQKGGPLFVANRTSLSDEAAEALAQHRGGLRLGGLTTLTSTNLAARLVADNDVEDDEETYFYCGWDVEYCELEYSRTRNMPLVLNRLRELTPSVAKVLATSRGALVLDGLESLSSGTALALSEHRGVGLSLNGLTSISPETAAALDLYRGHLWLNGLKVLPDEILRSFRRPGRQLNLDGVATLSSDQAAQLSGLARPLSLKGLTALDDQRLAAKLALTTIGGNFDNLRSISPQAAGVLAKIECDLSLNGLAHLSEEVASALAGHEGRLHLNGLTTLSKGVARILARHNGPLYLNGLNATPAKASLASSDTGAKNKRFGWYAGYKIVETAWTALWIIAIASVLIRGCIVRPILERMTGLSPPKKSLASVAAPELAPRGARSRLSK